MSVMITGVTGKLGQCLASSLIRDYPVVVGLSRNENALWELEQDFKSNSLKLYTGDIRNKSLISHLIRKHHICQIFHLAALKHTDRAEKNPVEYAEVNAMGTHTVIDTALKLGASVITISSDKAVYPVGTYGASKLIAENITLEANQRVVRLGNFIKSYGNIMRLFEISNPECCCKGMTRFFAHNTDIVEFIKNIGIKHGIYIPKMKSAKLGDIFDIFMGEYKESGQFRNSEKMHETLISNADRPVWENINGFYIGEKPSNSNYTRRERGFIYSSDRNVFWTKGEIKQWVK